MTGRGVGFLIISALFLLAGLATGYREIFLVVLCLALVLLYSFITALWGALALRAGQAVSHLSAVREESVRFRMQVHGLALLPVLVKAWVRLPDFALLSAPGAVSGGFVLRETLLLTGPLSRQNELALTVYCPHRGVWHIGVERLRAQDIFGFFSFPLLKRHRPAVMEARLTVYPAIAELTGELQPPLMSMEYSENTLVTADHGDSFSGTRQYRDGDSLKRIHWIQSVRTRQLYTRQYDISAEQMSVVLVDSILPPGANPTGCADMSTECAASLLCFYLMHGLPVRLFCPWSGLDQSANSMEDFQPLYGSLAALPFSIQPLAFDPAVLTDAALGPLRSLHIITDRLSHELLDTLRALTVRRCPVTCIIPPHLEAGPLAQHAQEVGVQLVSILQPEDIAVKLGDCL